MATPAITLEALRVEVAKTSEAWRGRLLDPEKLAALAKLLGFGWFTQDDIRGLWRIGLLRADLVSSDTRIDVTGLLPVGSITVPDRSDYCDVRTIARRPSRLLKNRREPERLAPALAAGCQVSRDAECHARISSV